MHVTANPNPATPAGEGKPSIPDAAVMVAAAVPPMARLAVGNVGGKTSRDKLVAGVVEGVYTAAWRRLVAAIHQETECGAVAAAVSGGVAFAGVAVSVTRAASLERGNLIENPALLVPDDTSCPDPGFFSTMFVTSQGMRAKALPGHGCDSYPH
jgi:hypothetical protein